VTAPAARGFLRECVPVFLGFPLVLAIAYALLGMAVAW
jgi:hypothetical protein